MTDAGGDAPIVLVGLPGAGKTTVGRAVAGRLGWTFIDLDEEIARAAGQTIPAIFATEGESGFRARERAATQALVGARRVVISPGGGWMANDGCVALLRPPAGIIHLRVGVDAALARMADDRAARPLLAGPDPRAALVALRERREPAYAGSDWVVDTEGVELQEVIGKVLELASRRSGG